MTLRVSFVHVCARELRQSDICFITECTGMGIQTIRGFFFGFCAYYAKHVFPEACCRPHGDQCEAILAQYEALGFPGAIGETLLPCVCTYEMTTSSHEHLSWMQEVSIVYT
jgi:hypothetical protein